jgi:uncharacterized protein
MSAAAPKSPWNPDRFDARAFAQAGAELSLVEPLARFERLAAECAPGVDAAAQTVAWQARGEMRPGASGAQPSVWLHVQARAQVPLTCQRCLAPVDEWLLVDRWFRFVADEATAAAEDEACEEDVLALEPRPSLRELIEDEWLMELPLVPLHERCPQPVTLSAGVIDEPQAADEAPRKNPFAALAQLKK